MQIRSPPRWLMIVSRTIVLLPVWRSPMISSRWPRPIGIIASIALMPVWSGSWKGWPSAVPGATKSDFGDLVDGVADRDFEEAAGGLDRVAFLDAEVVAEDDRADRVFLEVEDLAHRAVLEFEQLAGHRAAEAVDARD